MATNNLYTHYIAIDFGTSGCAIAVGFSKPEPEKIKVFSGWEGARVAIQIKYPTILLADPKGEFVSFGIKASKEFEKLKGKAQDYYLFHRFKMKLYDNPVRHPCVYASRLCVYACRGIGDLQIDFLYISHPTPS